jgi:hypothetical protein
MAKLRRIVRKVARPSGDYFDEKIWPVYIALVVLGAFLMGVSAAYLKFSGVPWYANAITSLVTIPIVVGGFMIAFRYIDNRLVRRSMQLAVVVSAILHLAMVVHMIETRIFAGLADETVAEREMIEPRRRRLLPEYQALQMLPDQERPRQDFEKPLETQTPEPRPEPENVARQQTHQPPQARPQPAPAPDPVAATEPNVIRRSVPNEAAPRAAEQSSRLSRQDRPSDLRLSQFAQLIPIEQRQAAELEAQPTAARTERQQTDPQTSAASVKAPATSTSATPMALTRQVDVQAAPADAVPQATLKRQVAEPTRTPTTPVASADVPPQPKSTSPEALAPASTFTRRQATASPAISQSEAPLPEIPSATTAAIARRRSPAEDAPQVGQSPTPVANRQPRTTTRPDVAAASAAPAPQRARSVDGAAELLPQSSPVTRSVAVATGSRPSRISSAEPTNNQTNVAAARPTRMEGSQTPSTVPSPAATATRSRMAGTPSVPLAAESQTPATAVSTSSEAELAAASTATRRQATASPQAAPKVEGPAAAQLAAVPQETPRSEPRRAAGASAELPSFGPTGPVTPSRSRSTATAVANIVTRAGEVPTNAGPQPADAALAGPSATSLVRQPSSATASLPATSASQSSAHAQGALAIATGGMSRTVASDVPTIRPHVDAGQSPARAATASPQATSPSAIDSPTASVASTGSQSAPQPARVAISRAQGGTAGVGRSANLERGAPGGQSPALVASASARRVESVSQQPADAFSPASAAQIARSTAGEVRPAAALRAESNAGNLAAAAEVSPLAASASATLARADARATRSDVTGAKGAAEVDLGPTQVVTEPGAGRAAGGGQPQPRVELSATQVIRSASGGGLPQVSLAAAEAASSVAAPDGESGGAPVTPDALVTGLAKAAATAPAAGGSAAGGAEASVGAAMAAQLLARTEMSRAEASDGAAGGAAPGQADPQDEDERARRLARMSQGGAPQLAVAGPTLDQTNASPRGDGGDASAATGPEALPAATAASRMASAGGAPAGGAALAAAEPGAAADRSAATGAAASMARAEAADGTPADPLVGGGTQSPAKASSAPTFSANTLAEAIQLAGAPESSGDPSGVALAARGTQTQRMAGGASGPVESVPQGAAAGDEVVLARAGAAAIGQRAAADAGGPRLAGGASQAPGKAGESAAPQASAVVADVPEVGEGSAVAQAELDHGMGGMSKTDMSRPSSQGLAVSVEALAGPGGLGSEFSPEVGLNSRRAREESLAVQTAATRFVRSTVGGLPAISTTAVVSREPFANRSSRLRGDQPGSGRGASSPETEAAIELGLEFLARHQHPDGHWSLQGFDDATTALSADERRFLLISDTGATALSLLAFQGGGYTHREHRYKDVVRRGIDHLLAYQKENGDLFVPLDDRSNQSVWLYSHALATLALCEAYGMTQDPALREPAQKAIDFIVASQNPELGGWRYSPGVGTDTSVTGWMIAALYSGRLAGLEVPSESLARIEKWMNSAQGSAADAHLYRYNPYAPDTPQQRHGRVPSKTMTAVGLLSRVLLGWKHDHPAFVRGAQFLHENLPAIGTPREPQRDTYYWYYATLTLVYLKERSAAFEPIWRDWERTLFPLLRDTQEKQGPWVGSWDPRGPVPDRWALHAGRLYVTTMNLLSLEANYRYLPVHTAVQGKSSALPQP